MRVYDLQLDKKLDAKLAPDVNDAAPVSLPYSLVMAASAPVASAA